MMKWNLPIFLTLGLLSLVSCRSSQPPAIEICILSPAGGGDCVEADGTQVFKTPSEMADYWATNQNDEERYSSWCYDSSAAVTHSSMVHIRSQITGREEGQ